MSKKRGESELQKPLYVAPGAMIVIILLVVCSGCIDLTTAYIPDTILTDGWYENTALRNSGSQLLGLEKWASATYEINGDYPASLTVTTMKMLIMMDEQELQQKTKETIQSTLKEGVTLNESTEVTGEKVILKAHKTMYMIYDGIDTSEEPSEKVKIIGEVWNCATSGTSIICIGIAYITNNDDNSSSENTDNWEKITGENGLIYNVICH